MQIKYAACFLSGKVEIQEKRNIDDLLLVGVPLLLQRVQKANGILERGLKRVNFLAFCNKINVESALDEEDLMNLMTCFTDLSNVLHVNENDSFQIISVVTPFDKHHVAHTSLIYNWLRTVYNRVPGMLSNE